ncbi:prepilin-type N-terminal cleavage/methylation domain-containing protein [Clostridium intestinale]|nr:prepilin-type N-terminal cleavage/methylation domain-containing protein [Clostridium intestinale]
MNMKNRKRGVTLIELIISIAILSIVILPIGSAVVTAAKINRTSENRQKATYNAQRILENMKDDQASDIGGLMSNISNPITGIGVIADEHSNSGWIYYNSSWQIVSNEANAYYKVRIELSDINHTEAAVNGNRLNTLNIISLSSLTYTDTDGDYNIGNSEIKITLKKVNENYLLEIDTDLTKSDNALIQINDCFDLQFNFKENFNSNQSLRIVSENNTDRNLNLYINKPENIAANYTIVNTLGFVNRIINSTPTDKYKEIKNSIEMSIVIYDKDDKKIANVIGYKNL